MCFHPVNREPGQTTIRICIVKFLQAFYNTIFFNIRRLKVGGPISSRVFKEDVTANVVISFPSLL